MATLSEDDFMATLSEEDFVNQFLTDGDEEEKEAHVKAAEPTTTPVVTSPPGGMTTESYELSVLSNDGDEEEKEAHVKATEPTTTPVVTSPLPMDMTAESYELSLSLQKFIEDNILSLPTSDPAVDLEVPSTSIPQPISNSEDFRSTGRANNLVAEIPIYANNPSVMATEKAVEAAFSSEVPIHGESELLEHLFLELFLSLKPEQEMHVTSAGHLNEASPSRFHSMLGAEDQVLNDYMVMDQFPDDMVTAHVKAAEPTTTPVVTSPPGGMTTESYELSVLSNDGDESYELSLSLQKFIEDNILSLPTGEPAVDPEVPSTSIPQPISNSEDFRSTGRADNLVAETTEYFPIAADNPSAVMTLKDLEAELSSEVPESESLENPYLKMLLSLIPEQEMHVTSAGHVNDASPSRFHSMLGAEDLNDDMVMDQSPDDMVTDQSPDDVVTDQSPNDMVMDQLPDRPSE